MLRRRKVPSNFLPLQIATVHTFTSNWLPTDKPGLVHSAPSKDTAEDCSALSKVTFLEQDTAFKERDLKNHFHKSVHIQLLTESACSQDQTMEYSLEMQSIINKAGSHTCTCPKWLPP